MVWTALLIYIGTALVWVRWRLWSILSWPLHLIVRDEDPQTMQRLTFRKFSKQELPVETQIPYALLWPMFFILGLWSWMCSGMLFALIRIRIVIAEKLPKRNVQPQAEA